MSNYILYILDGINLLPAKIPSQTSRDHFLNKHYHYVPRSGGVRAVIVMPDNIGHATFSRALPLVSLLCRFQLKMFQMSYFSISLNFMAMAFSIALTNTTFLYITLIHRTQSVLTCTVNRLRNIVISYSSAIKCSNVATDVCYHGIMIVGHIRPCPSLY